MGWVVGCKNYPDDFPTMMQWNGTSWVDIALSGEILNGYCLIDVDVVSDSDVWILGTKYKKSILLHWNGFLWKEILTSSEMTDVKSISAIGATNIWALDGNGIFDWDGSTWNQTKITVNYWDYINDLAKPDILALSIDDVWVGGSGLYHWDGEEWNDTNYDSSFGNIVDIEEDSDGNIWALTVTGSIINLFTN